MQGQNSKSPAAIEASDASLESSIKQKLQTMALLPLSDEQPTIHRVPLAIRQSDNKAYEPQLVSIGPYHHNKKRLKPMEEHKWRYLQAILSRNAAVGLSDYLSEITELEAQARRSYSESIKLNRNQFVEMMLLDGCFIVELLLKRDEVERRYDPIYDNEPLRRSVKIDMVLLENQLPYCILQCIYSLALSYQPMVDTLAGLAISFFRSFVPFNKEISEVTSYHHLLHLIHYHCLPSTPMAENSFKRGKYSFPSKQAKYSFPSAEKLKESGIKFIKKGSVVDVQFKNGVMKIPHLLVEDSTNSLFRNLIVFEQCYHNAVHYFTIYALFMDLVINTEADVEILCQKGILENWRGSNEEVALLFNKMGIGVLVEVHDTHLSTLFKDVTDYCKADWHHWRAILTHDYFNNPWSILSLIAAIVLLILTAIQTFYAVYPNACHPY